MTSHVLLVDPLPAEANPSSAELAATLRFVPSDEPVLTAFDAGSARGDGIFETLGARDGQPRALDAHLARLSASALKLDLPAPHHDQWRAAIAEMLAALPAEGHASLRLTITRGTGETGPTCWVTGTPITGTFPERRDGIKVVTLSRGYANDVGETAPWLLVGAKTLSYAINMAAVREAKRRGADDAIFTSTDGFALEGPTSSLLVRRGNTILTPAIQFGILAGTTQAHVFDVLEGDGFVCEYRTIEVGELMRADAVWLISSVRLAVPVTEIDGLSIPTDLALTERMNAALLS